MVSETLEHLSVAQSAMITLDSKFHDLEHSLDHFFVKTMLTHIEMVYIKQILLLRATYNLA